MHSAWNGSVETQVVWVALFLMADLLYYSDAKYKSVDVKKETPAKAAATKKDAVKKEGEKKEEEKDG